MSQGARNVHVTHAEQCVKPHFFDYATVKNNQPDPQVEILVGAGPRGESVRKGCTPPKLLRWSASVCFWNCGTHMHCESILVYCDQEEWLR